MKTVKEIRELSSRGETHNLEFKAKFETDKVGQALCALSNDWPQAGGGVLLIGVSDKTRAIVGFQENPDELQQAIANICRTAMSPNLAPFIYILELEKQIVVVEMPAYSEPPCRYKNDCYIRIGTTTRSASFYEEMALYKRGKVKGRKHMLIDKLPHREQPAYFVGRQNELVALWQWLRDSREFRCALAGDGGKGKTAIAYEFGGRIAEASPEPYELVLWASAKRKQFIHGEAVPIQEPDFKDLSSLLDKLLNDIGFPEDTVLPVEEKEEKVLKLLGTFPALVVIDDLDSIDWSSDVKTMAFLTYHLPHTKSKVLITTRRQIPSIPTVFIGGFTESEGFQFIDSRLDLAGAKADLLNQKQKREILHVTDSSALYIEDLVRLFITVGNWEETILQWSSRSGDEARSYALKREFEMLSDNAKKVLLAFAVLDQPATSAEAKAVANLTWANWADAVDELHRLFLISRPGIIEGLPRYALNSNTKLLVLSIMEDSYELTKVKQAVRAISGESYRDTERRKSVGTYINQASALIREGDCPAAEKTIKAGLQKLDQDPDLMGALGWVYKCFTPQHFEDARDCFRRAAELNCKNFEMYRHWYEMEEQAGSWNGAAEAAEAALKVFPKNQLWTFRQGYALSWHGQLLARQLQPRARVYLARAQKILINLSKQLRFTVPLNADLHMKTLRAASLNSAASYSVAPDKEKQRYLTQLISTVKEWTTEYGSEPSVDYEAHELISKYPELKERIHEA